MKIYKFGYFGWDEGYHYFLVNDKEYSDIECMDEYKEILKKEILEEEALEQEPLQEGTLVYHTKLLNDDQMTFNDVDSLVLTKLIDLYGFVKIEENVSFYINTNKKILSENNDTTEPIRKEYKQYIRAKKLNRIHEEDRY